MARKKPGQKNDKYIYVLYALVLLLIVLYILQNSIFIGALALISIAVTIIMEFKSSISSEGMKKTLIDLVIAVIAVIILVWVLPSFLLQSSSPTNVVASCSMLPVLHRGDLVLVHGISNFTEFVQQNHIPVVNVSAAAFNRASGNITSEFLEPLAYIDNNKADILTVPYFNGTATSYELGLYNENCLSIYQDVVDYSFLNKCFVSAAGQQSNLIRYNYSVANISVGGAIYTIPVTSSISIANTAISENYSNPVIVYKTVAGDSFQDSEIIHRVYAAIRVGGTYYFLTKGDNNPVLDLQAQNFPVSQDDVVGYLYATVPYLGYPSLIIKGQLAPVSQCNQTILHS